MMEVIRKIRLTEWISGIVIVIVLISISTFYLLKDREPEDTGAVVFRPDSSEDLENYPETRSIRTLLEVSNPVSRVMEQAQLLVYVPLALSTSQSVIKQTVSHPHQVLVDHLGNRALQFDFSDLPADANFPVTLESELRTANSPNQDPRVAINAEHAGVVAEHSDQTDYLGAESVFPGEGNDLGLELNAMGLRNDPFAGEFLREGFLLEVNSPEMQLLAQSLKTDQTDRTIERILTWVNQFIIEPVNKTDIDGPGSIAEIGSETMEVGFQRNVSGYMQAEAARPKGALQVLEDRTGGVWDKVMLVTALARACEISARSVVGYQMLDDIQLSAWVEFFKEGRWWIADVRSAGIQKNPSNYIAARVFDDVPVVNDNRLDGLLYSYFGMLVKAKTE